MIFMKFDIWVFFKTLSRKFKFRSNLTAITVLYMITPISVHVWWYLDGLFLERAMLQTKIAKKWKQISCSITFLSENRAVYEIHSFISIQPYRPDWQEPEPSHVTGMALAHCILGKYLGVVCHCFPPLLNMQSWKCFRVLRNKNSFVADVTACLLVWFQGIEHFKSIIA